MAKRITGIVFIMAVATVMVGCPPTEEDCVETFGFDQAWCEAEFGLSPEPPPGKPIVIGPGGGGSSISWSFDGTVQQQGASILQSGSSEYGLLRKDFIGSSLMHILCDRGDGNGPVGVQWVILDNGLSDSNRITLKIERTTVDDVRWTMTKGSSTLVPYPSTVEDTGTVPQEFAQLQASSMKDHTGASCQQAHVQVWMP